VSFSGNGSTANPQISTGEIFAVTPGLAYSASAWLACSVPYPSGVTVQIEWWTAASSAISSASSPAATSVTAVLAMASGTAPPTAAFASVNVVAGDTPASPVIFYAAAAPAP